MLFFVKCMGILDVSVWMIYTATENLITHFFNLKRSNTLMIMPFNKRQRQHIHIFYHIIIFIVTQQ